MKPVDPASSAQIAAADPETNVWLVANAGSGKTKVLTDRVARLLLRGTDPQNILCLTYTKAAAAEMQNRLFRRLGEWAMASDGQLRANLEKLGEGAEISHDALRLARQLFARAIETPGGIRIQTIHSFCAGLLRRFPLEAGVSPAFTELDDRSSALLRSEILDQMTEDGSAALFESVLPEVGEQVDRLLAEIVRRRNDLRDVPDEEAMRALLGLSPDMAEADLIEATFGAGDESLIATIVPILLKGKSTDAKAAALLAEIKPPYGLAAMAKMEGIFLFGAGAKAPFTAKVDSFPTKDTRAALGAHLDHLQGLMRRIEDARALRLALIAQRKAMTLHRFAAEFLRRYEGAKARRGWLDFDDFITRATALLTDPVTAPWVLYRLDGAIDHVLVDEAQDTSPAQWKIISALTEEFTAGEGARDLERSLFVVGDKKQSIYSFQGADVVAFDAWRDRFEAAFTQARAPLSELALVHSFRSSTAVLEVVDATFRGDHEEALGGAFRHQPFHEKMPGRVDLWPPLSKPEKGEDKEWYDPVDLVGETDVSVVLSEQIADEIKRMIDEGVAIPDHNAPNGARAVRAGDFLILVQRRGAIFEAIIRACKSRGLPIAGPDRLTLSEELAVRDILALLAFLNTAEDDLSLATALRSPLFGWSEAELYALAQPRPKGQSLWEAWRKTQMRPDSREIIDDLRRTAEYLRPYELIDRILTRHQGRAKLLGRMGEEAADAIDELSQQALSYERAEVPSLTGFLVWMAAGEVEVKRQAESEGAVIRVMTVHGSKGLEAPVVILPDTADRKLQDRDLLLTMEENLVTWAGRKAEDSGPIADEKARRADAREAENLRLLYVAMTRAKSWLIVAAAGECGDESWYGTIRKGMEVMEVTALPQGRRRVSSGIWPENQPVDPETLIETQAPDFALRPPAPAPAPLPLFAPSGLGGEKVLEGNLIGEEDEEEDALERGTRLHLALQSMAEHPPALWGDIFKGLDASEALAQEAKGIITNPEFEWMFGNNSFAEVEVSIPFKGGYLAGSIDRLVIDNERLVIIDFKSNRSVPLEGQAIPEGYLRQLGAYAHVMAALYPKHKIETAILWTRLPMLTFVPLEEALAALQRA